MVRVADGKPERSSASTASANRYSASVPVTSASNNADFEARARRSRSPEPPRPSTACTPLARKSPPTAGRWGNADWEDMSLSSLCDASNYGETLAGADRDAVAQRTLSELCVLPSETRQDAAALEVSASAMCRGRFRPRPPSCAQEGPASGRGARQLPLL